MSKKLYFTVDTETLGGATNPKCAYHISGIIHDNIGKMYATCNYLVASMYDMIRDDEYHKAHFEDYVEMVQTGAVTFMPTVESAIAAIEALLNHYGVEVVMAYNAGFDLVRGVCSPLIENREFIDLWAMAIECLVIRKKYAAFCRANNLKSSSGKTVSTSAETVYAYLTNNPDFEERHTAFEDSKIEMEIFLACVKAHKKYTRNKTAADAKLMYHLPRMKP